MMNLILMLISAVLTAPTTDHASAIERVKQAERQRVQLLQKLMPTVVSITDNEMAGGGSGVLLSSDGYGLTNFHVIMGMLDEGEAIGGLSDGKTYPLKILGIDPTGDVAMFRLIADHDLPHAELGNSDHVQVGDQVFAIGNPFMLAEDFTPTVTAGIVSGTGRYQFGSDQRSLVYTDCIQIDASINPGNSGGPLFDNTGKLIGINGRASFKHGNRVNVGLAYAISINQIKRFIPGLKAGLLVEHGNLGITARDQETGVIIDRVQTPSAGSQAGMERGDRLIALDGRRIESANEFLNLLGTYPAGWPVVVEFEHEGQVISKTVNLDRIPVEAPESWHRDEQVTRRAARDESHTEQDHQQPVANPLRPLIDAVASRTVKIYGAAIAREHGYASGIIISTDGQLITPLSLLLETDRLRCVINDGRVFHADVLYRDSQRQLALLKMDRHPVASSSRQNNDTQGAPVAFDYFPIESTVPELGTGQWLLVAGNPFKVAEGDELLSITRVIFAGQTRTDARRQTRTFSYTGPALLLDAVTSNPGAAGSAVVNLDGQLVGMVGKIVKSNMTNTFFNYAYPTSELQAFVDEARQTPQQRQQAAQQDEPPDHGIRLSRIGYRTKLPFVQKVIPNSPADKAGVERDDLIISINNRPVSEAKDFHRLMNRVRANEALRLGIKRDDEIIQLTLQMTNETEATP